MSIVQKKTWFVWSLLLLFILTPLSFDLNSADISVTSAFAKSGNNGGGNGNGSGNGHGGGNGNNGGSGHGQSSAEVGPGNTHEHSHAHGLGLGQDKQGFGHGKSLEKSKGSLSSKLGRLNAAHASAIARENAAPHSAVGRVAAYEAAVYERQDLQLELQALEAQVDPTPQQLADLEDARTAVAVAAQFEVETLSAAANKNIDEEVMQAVNELLGIEPLDNTLEVTSTTL